MTKALLANHGLDDLVCFGGGGARTRAQLVRFVEQIGEQLGFAKPGDEVVLACVDRYHFAASLLAVWSRGLVAALPPNGQLETVRELQALSGAGALLHDLDGEAGFDVRSVEDADARSVYALELPDYAQRPALIVYTSGSTGRPSAHPKSLAQLLAEPAMWIAAFGLRNKRVVSGVPAHHIYGLLFGVLVPLLGGGSMSRRTPVMPGDVLREIASVKAQVLVAVPPHLRALAAYSDAAWPALERVFSSGGPLPEATDTALRACGVRATQILGSTETGGIALRESGETVWRALPEVTLGLDGDECLLVQSPWATADTGAVLRTSDRAQLHPEQGGFTHLGRADSVVKVGGRRVDMREIEARLGAVSGVREAKVLEAPVASSRGVELWAVVECPGAPRALSELKQALRVHLDPVQMPRRFRVVSELPRNATGKVTRADLLALFESFRLPGIEDEEGAIHVKIPAELGYFRGHFPGQPILAGVVQLEQIALRQARKRWPELGVVGRIARVKFKRLVVPGDELVLRLVRKDAQQVQFQLHVGTESVSSGVLYFRTALGGDL